MAHWFYNDSAVGRTAWGLIRSSHARRWLDRPCPSGLTLPPSKHMLDYTCPARVARLPVILMPSKSRRMKREYRQRQIALPQR